MKKSGLALVIAAIGFASPVVAKNAKDVIMPESPQALAFQNAVGFADAVIAGDMVYLSGVVAVPAPDATSMKPAYEEAFGRIEKTLERAGVSWDDVVDMTTFHTDLANQINEFSEVKNRYVKAPFPAWTAIGNAILFEPTAVVEIKVVARKSN